jgi:hypothetical protein
MAENEGLLCIGVSAVASGPAVRLFSKEGNKRCRPHLRCFMMGMAGGCLGCWRLWRASASSVPV